MTHRILWHGNFLDGKLTLTVPEDQNTPCAHGTVNEEGDYTVCYVITAAEVEVCGHIHMSIPMLTSKKFDPRQLLDVVLVGITEHYTEEVMKLKTEAANHGQVH